jgi:dihydroorotase
MTDLLIKGGRVIDPAGGLDRVTDVAITEGKIEKIGPFQGDAEQTIDAEGMIVSPGLIDIHVHCREPGHEEEETVATASAAAVAGGFTTICAMPNTHPPIDDETAIHYVNQRARRADLARVRVAGAITKSREGKELAELGLMVEAGAVAFTDDGDGVASTQVMQRALQYAAMLDRTVMQHCQDPDLAGGSMNSGPVAVRLGLGGIAASGEEIMLRRDLDLVKHTGAAYHVQHVSCAGSVELIRQARADGLRVTGEATPHHLLLTDAACMTYDSNYKMNPPLRRSDDVEALRAGVADGTISVLATDHAPHAKEEKELEFALAPFGIISLDCALGLYVKALIDPGHLDWPELLRRMTSNPAAVIGRDDLGTLTKGSPADLTIIDPETPYSVDVDSFASKARNCPYGGWELHARAVATVVDGRIKFQR